MGLWEVAIDWGPSRHHGCVSLMYFYTNEKDDNAGIRGRGSGNSFMEARRRQKSSSLDRINGHFSYVRHRTKGVEGVLLDC